MKAGSVGEVIFGLTVFSIIVVLVDFWPITLAVAGLIFIRVMYAAWLGTERQQEKRARARTWEMYEEVCRTCGHDPDKDRSDELRTWLLEIINALPQVDKSLHEAFLDMAYEMYLEEGFDDEIPAPPVICNSLEGARYRDRLSKLSERIVQNDAREVARDSITKSFRSFLEKTPSFRSGDRWGSIPLRDIGHVGEMVEALIWPLYDDKPEELGLFAKIRRRLNNNLDEASGVDPNKRASAKKLVMPSKYTGNDPVSTYLKNTPLLQVFDARIDFRVPEQIRFEHTMVVGGSGHGKTTLLADMILGDIEKAKEGGGGFAIIDPKGSLVDSIARLECFAPGEPLSERLVIIDPRRDVEYAPAINMFDLGIDDASAAGTADRLAIRNNALEMIEYMFSELLKVEMTGRQEVAFNFVGDLMMNIERASIQTLLDFLNHPDDYRDAISRCDKTTREYLENHFITDRFRSVRDQLSDRVYGVLKLPMMEAMLSHEKTKVNIAEAVKEGKIVLINANENFLSTGGSSVFGSVWIGLLFQACLSRVSIPKDERKPFTLYIDEASMYFSEKLRQMLIKAREFNLGVVFAFQDLEQIEDPRLRSSALGSTSTKFVGGLNARDRRALAQEMNTTEEYLRTPRKRQDKRMTEFATYVRGVTEKPVMLSYTLGRLDDEPKMSDQDYVDVLDWNREQISVDRDNSAQNDNDAQDEVDLVPEAEDSEPDFTYEEED